MKNTSALYALGGIFTGFALAHIAGEPGWFILFVPAAACFAAGISLDHN